MEEDVFWLSQHVDDPSVFADGFPFLLNPSLDFDRARLQDHFAALVVEEGAELVRAGWFRGVVGLLCVLISIGAFQRLGSHERWASEVGCWGLYRIGLERVRFVGFFFGGAVAGGISAVFRVDCVDRFGVLG